MLWATMLLVGGQVHSSYKWGFFVFAVLIYFFIVWQVLGVARSYARRVEPGVHKIYLALAAWVLGLMYDSYLIYQVITSTILIPL